jgi:hypothetical protein
MGSYKMRAEISSCESRDDGTVSNMKTNTYHFLSKILSYQLTCPSPAPPMWYPLSSGFLPFGLLYCYS